MGSFFKKLWNITAGLAFTFAGSAVVLLTLSGRTKRVAAIATAIAITVHYIYELSKDEE
jgi:hypothetical protein